MVYVGIDYSLTSPCVAVYDPSKGDFSFDNCEFHFVTHTKSLMDKFGNIKGWEYPLYSNDESRYDALSEWVNRCAGDQLMAEDVAMVGIEGYSMGSKGRVFNLAENCGLLKWKLWYNKIPFTIFAPTVIKKFATGKGNADKTKMYEAFLQETGKDIAKLLTPNKTKIDNPVSDIVDAYYILKLTYETASNK